MPKIFLPMLLFFNIFLPALADSPNLVEYPYDYRNWPHVKSMLILPGHPLETPFAGIHHIYANEAALNGLRNNHYQNGAVFVFDLLEAHAGDHTFSEGSRKLVGVMVKDSNKYSTTGGWGFEGFAGNSQHERLTKDGGESCYGCHTQRSDKDFVFTTLRD